jgi:hypothetical protein
MNPFAGGSPRHHQPTRSARSRATTSAAAGLTKLPSAGPLRPRTAPSTHHSLTVSIPQAPAPGGPGTHSPAASGAVHHVPSHSGSHAGSTGVSPRTPVPRYSAGGESVTLTAHQRAATVPSPSARPATAGAALYSTSTVGSRVPRSTTSPDSRGAGAGGAHGSHGFPRGSKQALMQELGALAVQAGKRFEALQNRVSEVQQQQQQQSSRGACPQESY